MRSWYTGFSSEIGTKLRDWAVGQAGGSCYSRAALSSNDSKTRYMYGWHSFGAGARQQRGRHSQVKGARRRRGRQCMHIHPTDEVTPLASGETDGRRIACFNTAEEAKKVER